MIRKIVISICIVLGIGMFLSANREQAEEGQAEEHKQEWTNSANAFINELVQEAVVIKDSVEKSRDYLIGNESWSYFEWDNEIYYWTSNEWAPDSIDFTATSATLTEHKSGWDLLIPVQPGRSILTRKLTRNEAGQFSEVNQIDPLKNLRFELTDKETPYALMKGEAYIDFFGRSSYKKDAGKKHVWAYVLLLLAAFISFNFWKPVTYGLGALALLVRYVSLNRLSTNGLDKLPVFDPVVFASSELLPSLGDLMLHVLVGLILVLAVVEFLTWLRSRQLKYAIISLFLAGVFGLLGADLIRSLISNLVLNSNISFDITNLSSIDLYTILSASLIAVLCWLWYAIVSSLVKVIHKERFKLGNATIAIVLGGAAAFVFQMMDANRSFEGLLPSAIFSFGSLGLLVWARFLSKRQVGLYKYVIYILFFSFFYSSTLNVFQQEREEEYLSLYASKLVSNKDLPAEYLFKEMENSLAQLFLQPEDFEAFSKKKEQFEKRLRRLYFSGYLDKYNMLVLSFDSIGNNINSSTLYNIEDLDEIYNFKSFPTLSNHFYQVKSDRIFNGYLAKFENCDLYGHYGSVFILLEPKFIQSSYEYPQLVSKKKESKIFDLDEYSYALYSNNILLNQKGTYPYDLRYDSSHFVQRPNVFHRRSYRHFISRQEGAKVVLSHPNNRFKASISTFSFSFIFFVLLFTAFGLGWVILLFVQQSVVKRWSSSEQFKDFRFSRKKQMARLGIEQVYLSTRIRLAMVSLVFLGLLVSIYVTIQFIEINHQNRSENELMYKIREVANQLQNEVDFAKKLGNTESRQLIVN
ncbi:MAG: hypothetical protein JJ975_16690, partial [Bacteroidia bacterium]|nr:hypothetical protein [Bacteroidia bacterium]